jgi:hypothetical protein
LHVIRFPNALFSDAVPMSFTLLGQVIMLGKYIGVPDNAMRGYRGIGDMASLILNPGTVM